MAPGTGRTEAGQAPALDRIWGHTVLYESAGNGPIQRLALSGRLQYDLYRIDARQGDDSDALWRRFRFGFKAKLSRGWEANLESDLDLNRSSDHWYTRLTDAYVGWTGDSDVNVRVLKHSAGFTLDGATSSKSLLTLQRNNLTNNLWFPAEYFTGLSATGSFDGSWSYKAGVFSTDGSDELGFFDASYFLLGSLGYAWAEPSAFDHAEVRLDVVHNDAHPDSNTRELSTVVSLSSKLERGPWGLWTDVAAGEGYSGQSDLWGLVLMPFYNASDLVQLVFRYTHLDSKGDNGIRLGRYENQVVDGRGDDYDELYAGLNLFFYGHRLKWQTGLQFTSMRDEADDGGAYRGWGISTGLRLSW